MTTIARVPRSKGVSWKAIIKQRGRVLRTKTFRTKTAARDWSRRIEAELERADALDNPGHRIRFSELVALYLGQWSGRDHHRRTQVDWWNARLGSRLIADIRADEIRLNLSEYAQGQDRPGQKPRAPASVNRMRAALSAMFRFAIHQGIAVSNPVRRIPSLTEHNLRDRYLSKEEREALLKACRQSQWDRLHLLVLLAMMTGARKGELKSLRWEWIDFTLRQVRLPKTKNGQPRVLTLPHAAVRELMTFRHREGLVFQSSFRKAVPTDEKKHWVRALKKAEIENFRFHDLRHTAASYLAMGGATLLEIAEVLGHRSIQTTKRYAHLSVSHKQALTDRLLGDLDETGLRT